MLRSLFSGISGLRAHQQMMDVTGNNIANVNTTGYKSSQTVFQDTLSQMVGAAGAPQGQSGGTNPAQVGLGVRLASITANFGQGAAQTTGKSSDMMIQGDGFFVVKSGGESLYTRAGSFSFDANGSLTTPNIGVSLNPTVTENITMTGNFSNEAVLGTKKEIPLKVYDAAGAAQSIVATFEKTGGTEWTMSLPDGSSHPIQFENGKAVGEPDPDTGVDSGKVKVGEYNFDIHDLTQFSGDTEARVSNSDGSGAGVLSSYTVSNTGQIVGVFSNGLKQTLGQVALANFNNVNGLEKIGDSMFRSTVNSGLAQVGAAGSAGLGLITSGALEMSNVDLAQEFTNLVIAQRGFQANSRVITTSDEILQELVNLKR
jgi:flagellar hook protein FlgE